MAVGIGFWFGCGFHFEAHDTGRREKRRVTFAPAGIGLPSVADWDSAPRRQHSRKKFSRVFGNVGKCLACYGDYLPLAQPSNRKFNVKLGIINLKERPSVAMLIHRADSDYSDSKRYPLP